MAQNSGLIIADPYIDIALGPISGFQRETKVKIRADIVNMFSKTAYVQWEIYPTSAPKEKVILPTKTAVAKQGHKVVEKLFEGLNPNTEYTVVARVTNLSTISGGKILGEYWKTISAKTLIMSRNLQAYRIGTTNVTAKLINLTKYPYNRQVKFYYKKQGESTYKLSGTINLPEGENGSLLHVYELLQQNTTYIFYVEVYRTDKNKGISYLSMTVKTKVYIPDGLPDPFPADIIPVANTTFKGLSKVKVEWEGQLGDGQYVALLWKNGSSWVPVSGSSSVMVQEPGYVKVRHNLSAAWVDVTQKYKFAVVSIINGEIVILKDNTQEFEITFPALPTISSQAYAEYVVEYANAFAALYRYVSVDGEVSEAATEAYERLIQNIPLIEEGNIIYGGLDSVFANLVSLANALINAGISEWEDHSEEPVEMQELSDLFNGLKGALNIYGG